MTATFASSTLLGLVERAQDGDADANEDLCRHLYPTMEKWLFGMIRERHSDVKETLVLEVLQETWLQLQRKLHQFKGSNEAALLAWMYRVTFATCKNYLKKYVRTRQREEPTEEVPEPVGGSGAPDPRQTLIEREKLAEVREAVLAIPNEKQREAIVLFFFEELSQKEIADRMGATESAVSTWVYRGKAEIGKYLTEKGFQP